MHTARVLLVLTAIVAVAACQPSNFAQARPITAESVALQPTDVTGMLRCDGSGDVNAVIQQEKTNNPYAYDENAPEWERWQIHGATQAYFVFYGETPRDCATLSGSSTGAPPGALMVALVVKFKDEPSAVRIYGDNSTFFGFGPKDLTFIKLAGGRVTTGSVTGLGQESAVGRVSVVGATYYMAFWQRKRFDSFLIAYDVMSLDAERAVMNVNGRIQ
jgi:hypothetical protein